MSLDRHKTKFVRDPETEPSLYRMREMEVQRTGRTQEFSDLFDRVQLENPEFSKVKLNNLAYKYMGLGSDSDVVRRYREFQGAMQERRAEALDDALSSEEKAAREKESFASVLLQLPESASRVDVMSWIENHEAMILDRETDRSGRVILTAADIVDAPSRSAVGQLQNWIANKEAFYKEWIKRKPSDDLEGLDGPSEDDLQEHDPTLADVIKFLDQLN